MIMLTIIPIIITIIVYCKYRQLSGGFLLGQSFLAFQRSLKMLPTQGLLSEKVGALPKDKLYDWKSPERSRTQWR